MAVSYRIVIFLIALVLFGVAWGIGNEVVMVLDPIIMDHMETSQGEELHNWVSQLWLFLPLFVFMAAAAWLLKQGVIVQR